ncbi:MAG TPA: hypothetical protein PKA82_14645 [Pyrinomonadaceae bacterium]|nr:hypothetical protein [Pyrinomonadaceae bacterium]
MADRYVASLRTIGVIITSTLLLFGRKPEIFLNPQFWAEDGRNWYADAYNADPLVSIFTTEAGYFQTSSRIIASISQLFPLAQAPLVFNLSAVLIQAGVAAFIVSDRCRGLIESRYARYALAFLYLVLPNAWEVYGNLTNAQWHLALLVCLIVVTAEPISKAGRIFDFLATMLSVVSGPFCLLLFPISLARLYLDRTRHKFVLAAIISVGCAIQAFGLLTSTREVQSVLGASLDLFFQIVGRHLVLGPLLGVRGFLKFEAWGLWGSFTAIVVAIAGLAYAANLLRRVSNEIRLFFLYAILICITALVWPAVTLEPGQWTVIANNATAQRYWFVPCFVFYCGLLFVIFSVRSKVERSLAVGLLLISSYGIISDYKIPPMRDLDFRSHAAEFERAEPGTTVAIPINPDWKMELKKK